jgi:hypothetical protein
MIGKKNPVCIVANPETEAVVSQSKNPEIGYITLCQMISTISKNNFEELKARYTTVFSDFNRLLDTKYIAGQVMPGNIILVEQLEPFSDPKQDIKMGGPKGNKIPCTINGQLIYSRTRYIPEGEQSSTIIQHDNVAELRSLYQAAEAAKETQAEELEI